MHGTIAFDQRLCIGSRQLAIGIFQGFGRQVGIEAYERLTQASLQHYIPIVWVATLGEGLTGCDVRAM